MPLIGSFAGSSAGPGDDSAGCDSVLTDAGTDSLPADVAGVFGLWHAPIIIVETCAPAVSLVGAFAFHQRDVVLLCDLPPHILQDFTSPFALFHFNSELKIKNSEFWVRRYTFSETKELIV